MVDEQKQSVGSKDGLEYPVLARPCTHVSLPTRGVGPRQLDYQGRSGDWQLFLQAARQQAGETSTSMGVPKRRNAQSSKASFRHHSLFHVTTTGAIEYLWHPKRLPPEMNKVTAAAYFGLERTG
jgi:hypothetical protein